MNKKEILEKFKKELTEVYSNWYPKIGDPAVIIDFRNKKPRAIKQIVRKFNDGLLQTSDDLKCMSIEITNFENLKYYIYPVFTVPLEFFEKLSESTNFEMINF